MNIRCVITGQKESGKSVFVRDAPVAPVTLGLLPGFEFHRLWGSESVVDLPSDGMSPHAYRLFQMAWLAGIAGRPAAAFPGSGPDPPALRARSR
jgi:hypothetical protein